jgi:hypothetical protein
MIEQCGLHESCIGQINDKIDAVKQDTDRMIIGLYGGLDKPNSGFAHEISSAIKDLTNGVAEINEKVNGLAGEWQDRKKRPTGVCVGRSHRHNLCDNICDRVDYSLGCWKNYIRGIYGISCRNEYVC